LCLFDTPPPPRSPLFPYTTLFRSGANYGPWVPPFVAFLEPPSDPVGLGIGHFLGAMRVDGFRPAQEFKQHMDNWVERFKRAKPIDRKSTRLNSSHVKISYAVFCLK